MNRLYFPSKRGGFWRRLSPIARRKQRQLDKAWAIPRPGDRLQVEVGYRKPQGEPLEPLTGHVVANFTAEAGVGSGEMTWREHGTGEVHTDPISMLYDGENGLLINLVSGDVVGTVGNRFPGDEGQQG